MAINFFLLWERIRTFFLKIKDSTIIDVGPEITISAFLISEG